MSSYSSHFPDLVKILIYNHCHSNAPENQSKIQKRLANGLDFDQAKEVINEAADELSFIHTERNQVWYVQNRQLLVYVRDETELYLPILSDKFNHLKPPDLEEEFKI